MYIAMNNKKKLMAIDGNSLMHRAYYAIQGLSNKKGVPTNAIYGFTNVLLKLLQDYEPEYVGVAFDRKAPTFRHKEYKEYKETRQKTPEELIIQFDIVKELLKRMNIAIYEIDGYEADDILGTFARIAEENDLHALLVTGDRDALQLVSQNTHVLLIRTRKGMSEVQIFDPEELKNAYGLTPEQIIDLKGLMGDSSDNIPGVPGVGEKTALKLLEQYSTLENILEHIDEISGKKLKENLTIYKEQAILSKKLATIIKDVPIDIKLEDCCYNIPRTEELRDLLEELEFKSIIKKLGFEDRIEAEAKPSSREKEIISIKDLKDLEDMVDNLASKPLLSMLVGDDFTIACTSNKLYRIPLRKDLISDGIDFGEALQYLQPILTNEKIRKIVYDGKTFMKTLEQYDVKVNGLDFDVFVAAYLLDPVKNKYELAQLMYEYLGAEVSSVDAADLILLADVMKNKLKEYRMEKLYSEIEHPLIFVLKDMEETGFKVDKTILQELDVEFSKELKTLTQKIYDIAGEEFNINSPKQLGDILFEKLNLPVIKKTKTGYSTDVQVLEQLVDQHEIIEYIIEYRQVMKLKSTYIDGLMNMINTGDGRIHSNFNQTVTATGRISSTEPNLQNIPVRMEMGRQIRRVFVASDENHVLVDADYSQIELRVLAHISQDERFIDAFLQGQDIHRRTAAEIFGIPIEQVTPEQRSSAKAVNFGIVYGISDFGLAKNLGISRAKAKKYIDSYFSRYPGIKEYMDEIVKQGKEKGYVETLMGRRRNLPELASRNHNIRSFGERVAMNTPIQGTAADIIKKAMNDVYYGLKERGLRSKLILQVHDELIIDTYLPELEEVKTLVKDKMENAVKLDVPLVVDIGTGFSWYDAK